MRRFAALVAALMVATPLVAKNLPLSTVQLLVAKAAETGWSCTAWSYKYGNGAVIWLSNAHCILDEENGEPVEADVTIGGQKAYFVAANQDRDLSMWVRDDMWNTNQRTLQLAASQPSAGDASLRIGYPVGLLLVSAGVVSNPAIKWQFTRFPVALYDYHSGPGASGSPVLDSSGRVVGMNAFGYGTFAGGPTLYDLKLFILGDGGPMPKVTEAPFELKFRPTYGPHLINEGGRVTVR